MDELKCPNCHTEKDPSYMCRTNIEDNDTDKQVVMVWCTRGSCGFVGYQDPEPQDDQRDRS